MKMKLLRGSAPRAAAALLLAAVFCFGLCPCAAQEKSGADPAGSAAAAGLEPAAVQPAAALPDLSALLPAKAVADMGGSDKAVRTSEKGDLIYLPDESAAGPLAAGLREALAAQKPGILVEAAFVLRRKAPAASELGSIWGILCSLHSLEGIQYWSATRKSWRTFYAESYRIDGPTTKKRIADPPFPAPGAELPAKETLYAFQRDLSFGSNVYRYTYESSAKAVGFECRNLTNMSYGIIPAVGANELSTRVLIAPASDGILFYAVSATKSPGLSFLKAKMLTSFGNRAEALFKWFSAQHAALK